MNNTTEFHRQTEAVWARTEAAKVAAWKYGDTVRVQVGNEVKQGQVVDVWLNSDTTMAPVGTVMYSVEYPHRQTLRAYQAATEGELHALQPYPLELQLDALVNAETDAWERLRTAQTELQLAVDAKVAGNHELLRWFLARGSDQ